MRLPVSFTHAKRWTNLFALMGASLALSACSSVFTANQDATPKLSDSAVQGVQSTKEPRFLGIFSPYRIDIQQGNFVSSEMMDQVRDGMKRKEGLTREQVRFLLGTPLIADPFHKDRWDYAFRLKRGNGDVLSSHVALYFKDDKLDRIDGSALPTEKDYITLIAGSKAYEPPPYSPSSGKKEGKEAH